MRYYFFLVAGFFITGSSLNAQNNNLSSQESAFLSYTGNYGTKDSTLFSIVTRDKRLFFNTPHYGNIEMIVRQDNRLQLKNVKPEAFINFKKDDAGKIIEVIINQKGKFTWIKINDTAANSPDSKAEHFPGLIGKYRQDIDLYNFCKVWEDSGILKINSFVLLPIAENKFLLKDSTRHDVYEFIKDNTGKVQKLIVNTDGPQVYQKRPEGIAASLNEHISNRKNGFTHADTLRGMLTSMRTCYDVLFYDLNITIEPETKSIHGNTTIRFKTIESFDSIQVDLYANMKIEKILFHNQPLSYTREFNAVYIHFPQTVAKESIEEITIFYSGQPRIPDIETSAGGFFWVNNREGKLWIESVCQGAGASLWWPCKDHLSDKPDSMKISITVPKGLTDISNGKLLKKTDLPNGYTCFDWYVSYPINSYDVVVNIGDYTRFFDEYISAGDTLALKYYCMPYNLGIAKNIFKNVKPMLALYEKYFGKYPFKKDGFTLMESFYAMEHQSAVTIGYLNSPFNSNRYDSAELTRLMWHETAHEWWGNSITCKDNADMWIHEAFATYAEVLCYEAFAGKEASLKYLKNLHPDNKEPVIGVYNVNHFHMGDMYPKGGLMLHTLRNVIDNDSLWFSILKNIQEHFKYQAVTTEDIVGYFNEVAGKNYTPIFDQYLRYATIPELELLYKKNGSTLEVRYKWNTDVTGFNMPIKVTKDNADFTFIYPTNNWQTLNLQNMNQKDFKVDRTGFYVNVKEE